MQEKITYGFEYTLNYSRDDFHKDGHATHDTSLRGKLGVALPETGPLGNPLRTFLARIMCSLQVRTM